MEKIKFKGKVLTKERIVRNINRYHDMASPEEINMGLKWYEDAHIFCINLSERFGVSVYQAAGIVASLSPQCSWNQNKTFAIELLSSSGKKMIGTWDRTKKARKILKTNDFAEIYRHLGKYEQGAPKVRAFFENIARPYEMNMPVIDRHQIASCILRPEHIKPLGENLAKITAGQYNFFASCYTEAAKQLGVLPGNLQAIVWGVVRRLRDLKQYEAVPIHGWDNVEVEVA